MKFSRSFLNVALLMAAFCLPGCAIESNNNQVSDNSLGSDPAAVIVTNRFWPDYSNIPVCLVGANSVEGEVLSKLRKRAVSEFEKAAITLTGWNPCEASDVNKLMIRIKVLPASVRVVDRKVSVSVPEGESWFGPGSKPLQGENLANVKIGVTPFWNHEALPQSLVEKLRESAYNSILHEISHSLGLHHEHLRTDAPATLCEKGKLEPQVPESDKVKYVASYDSQSVTNYCAKATSLSDNDVLGLKEIVRLGKASRESN